MKFFSFVGNIDSRNCRVDVLADSVRLHSRIQSGVGMFSPRIHAVPYRSLFVVRDLWWHLHQAISIPSRASNPQHLPARVGNQSCLLDGYNGSLHAFNSQFTF